MKNISENLPAHIDDPIQDFTKLNDYTFSA